MALKHGQSKDPTKFKKIGAKAKPKRPYKIDYVTYINSDAWRRKRAERLKIDNYRCQMCNSSNLLNVHHITYASFGNEDMAHLITLCPACHKKVHEELNGKNADAVRNSLLLISEMNLEEAMQKKKRKKKPQTPSHKS